MLAKADGRLRHCFFGDYSAVIALGFRSEYEATEALPKLGSGWNPSEKNKSALIWSGDSDALKACKETLVSFGANEKAIDSIAHSIDYGDPFSIQVEIVPKEQLRLFA